jgi:rhodanese-related sulfurtransferase
MSSSLQIPPEHLFSLIGRPDCPVLIDGRIDEDFDADPRMIPGSRRLSCFEAEAWAPGFVGRRIVVICDRGLKLSEGAAAWARAGGVDAVNLGGGYQGWRDAGYPVIPRDAIPNLDGRGRAVWVAGADPSLARLASAWLIRRFVNPDAVFLFVTPSEVTGVADRMSATPLDPFDRVVARYGPDLPAVTRMAEMLRVAEGKPSDDASPAADLSTLFAGIRGLHANQLDRLHAAFGLFDALHAGLRR